MRKNYEFEQVVTKTGDGGTSGTHDGVRLPKYNTIFEVVGTLDELSSWLGKVVHSFLQWEDTVIFLRELQLWLQYGGSMVATDPMMGLPDWEPRNPLYTALKKVTSKEAEIVEAEMQALLKGGVKIVNGFVIPGGTPKSADIDIARTVCRRAERCLVRYMDEMDGSRFDLRDLSVLLNRTSDYLFLLARAFE